MSQAARTAREIDRRYVAIAGLLHDIGKFRQRACWGDRRSHVEHGTDCWELLQERGLRFADPGAANRIREAIAQHHARYGYPYGQEALLVKLADHLAAGERLEREEEDTGFPPNEPLRSVFASITLEGRPQAAGTWTYQMQPLAPDKSLLPTKGTATTAYRTLWLRFKEAVRQLSPSFLTVQTVAEADAFLAALLHLLRAFTWCLPDASFKNRPDIALVDHLHLTAALAVCLADFSREQLQGWEDAGIPPEQPVALLVGGDVSGIQKFLYTISSHGAARSLRGRSLYLGLIADTAADYTRRELDLPPVNLLYASGGHFWLLAPLSASARLAVIQKCITGHLLTYHRGDLALALAAVEVRAGDCQVRQSVDNQQGYGLGGRWHELSRKLSRQKRHLLGDIALVSEDGHAQVFGPWEVGGEEIRCEVCHAEREEWHSGVTRELHPEQVEQGLGINKCSLCESFEELAQDAAQAEFVIIRSRHGPVRDRTLRWHTVLADLGVEYHFVPQIELSERYQQGDLVFRVNKASLLPEAHIPVVGFRFLPQVTPWKAEDQQGERAIRSLDEIVQDSAGPPYWAALRMDVDNLGRLFQAGLGETYSFSRLMTLSRALTWFFEGYLTTLGQHVDQNCNVLHLLYSGGDDLFAIGAWNRVLTLAAEIREHFHRYTCENPAITLSGGLSLHPVKFPLYQAAYQAGEHLELAKAFQHSGHRTDAFGLWGPALSWEEFSWLAGWQHQFVEWSQQGKALPEGTFAVLSRRFFQKLGEIAALAKEDPALASPRTMHEVARDLERNRRWRWLLVYWLSREAAVFRGDLERFQDELLRDLLRLQRLPTLLALLARWCELMTRRREA